VQQIQAILSYMFSSQKYSLFAIVIHSKYQKNLVEEHLLTERKNPQGISKNGMLTLASVSSSEIPSVIFSCDTQQVASRHLPGITQNYFLNLFIFTL